MCLKNDHDQDKASNGQSYLYKSKKGSPPEHVEWVHTRAKAAGWGAIKGGLDRTILALKNLKSWEHWRICPTFGTVI